MNLFTASRLTVLAIVLSVTLGSATSAAAQTLDRAEITGTIRDETGATLGAVTVTLRETTTGFERTTVTGLNGRYSAPLLPVGVYVVRAERAGFSAAASESLTLTVGQALVADIVMRIAGLTDTVSVSARGDTASALGTVIDANALVNLPIDGRDYRDFALLSPTTQSILGTRGTFRVAGQPGDYLALNVDGADFTNNFFGEFFGSLERRNFTIPLEAVQEFDVTAGGLGAESGRSNGGLVNVVTKSGGNQPHGSLIYVIRHHALTADDAFGNPPVGLVRHVWGGSLGGPLVADRTFYFVAADAQRQTTPVTVAFARPVTGIAVPELGIPDLSVLEGQYPRRENVTTLLGKIHHEFTRNHLTVRGSFSKASGRNIAGGTPLLSQAPSNLETFRNEGLSVVTSVGGSVGSRAFFETKIQTSRETRPRTPQGSGPQVQISDTGTFGGALFLPATQDMYRYQVSQSVVSALGSHNLTVGADYNAFNMRNNAFALALNGAYTFPSLEAFVERQPLLYAQNFGLGGRSAEEAALLQSYWQHEAALYVQDRFRPTPRLTIGLGLRYDMQVNPQPQAGIAGERVPVGPPVGTGNRVQVTYAPVPQGIPDDLDNWGPRADIAFQLPGRGMTIIKGSAGLYYGRTPMIYFPLRGAGISNVTLFSPPSRFGVTFPEVLPSTLAPGSALERLLGSPAISYVDPSFENPRVFQLNVSLTRRVAGVTLETGYILSESRNLRIGGFRSTLWDRNLAPPTRVDAFGRGIDLLDAGRPDPSITQANALSSFGRGRYQALLVSLTKPMGNGLQFYTSYTLAKSQGNGSTERDTEGLFGPSDPFNLDADYGINEADERHQVKSYLVLSLPHDFMLTSTWTGGSGPAFPVYSPTDLNGDGVTNQGLNPDRPVSDAKLLPRFPEHQPAWFTWDFRVAKGFALAATGRAQLLLEVFNLLNTDNTFADPRTQAILGSPNFRVRNRTLGPRIAQLGMRFDF